MRNKVIVHCLVKNEENFIWYALQSVLPFVDKIMVWDTGSEDKTVEIINSINSSKIDFVEKGSVDSEMHTKLRAEMLDKTDKKEYRWLLILDGDEVWGKKEITKMIKVANQKEPSAIVVRTINLVGDIYHKLPKSSGKYEIAGQKGHLSIRIIDLSLKNLKVMNPHGGQTYTTSGIAIQDLPAEKLYFSEELFFFHTTHLERSSLDNKTLKRSFKRKYELGEKIKNNLLPEIFFQKHPSIVPDVTKAMSLSIYLRCLIETIPKRIKRKFFPSKKSGYI
ncbi:MAG: Glycosyl transferase family 2 [candidate division WWE3 bacterium GW2011_GWF2_43_18]|nr:MAG: Glycosyl transferase family 2 [candidate division WWE3 bacterium GW2011_GWF2_43_18]